MKKIFSLCAFIIFTSGVLYSQYHNVHISSFYYPNETSIMINPLNPNQIVAGANANSSTSWSGYYYSTNGGNNWLSGFIISTAAFPSGDPVIIVDTLGHFYFIQNANGWNHQPRFDVHLVCKSTNGGMNWSNGVTYGKNGDKLQDKPWGCVDLSHGPYGNYIYITWTEFDVYMSYNPLDSSRILFTRSTNGGQSFSTPKRISRWGGNAIDSSNTVEGAVPCVGINGEVFVSWAGPRGICFNKSTNAGLTWLGSEITAVPPYPGGWAYYITGILRCNGMPVTCCDVSNGPYRGTIYINWSDQRNGPEDTDIWLVKSTNGGLNWSAPKRVNNDPPGKQQFLTWMSVDPVTGYIYVVFYDRRNYTSFITDVYLARSTDGGQTFGNVKISQTAFSPIGNIFIGDYNGISVFNNKIRPIWTRVDYNTTSIWTAIIDSLTIGVTKINEIIPEDYYLSQNYPNPFNPETKISYKIPKTGFVSMKIYDARGRQIKSLIEENQSAGEYELIYNAGDLSSGVYFYRIQSNEFTDTKKMVLER